MCGDINCDMNIPNNRLGFSKLHVEQLIKTPTHFTENSATLIDVIATNSADIIEDAKVEPPSLSRHCDVSVLLNMRKPNHENTRGRYTSTIVQTGRS